MSYISYSKKKIKRLVNDTELLFLCNSSMTEKTEKKYRI